MAPALRNYVPRQTAGALIQIKIVLRNIYHFVFHFQLNGKQKGNITFHLNASNE